MANRPRQAFSEGLSFIDLIKRFLTRKPPKSFHQDPLAAWTTLPGEAL